MLGIILRVSMRVCGSEHDLFWNVISKPDKNLYYKVPFLNLWQSNYAMHASINNEF